MQTLPLPQDGREVVSKRPYVQVHQTQIKEEENNEKNIVDDKESNVKSARKKQ